MPRSLPPAPRSRHRAATLLACLVGLAVLGPGAPATVQAATRDYYFTPIGSEQGLAQNSVTAMVQDPEGFVWVGTQGGLHRYDGERYVAYRNEPGDPASLPESFVTALAADADNRALWVGLYSHYLARIDLESGRIERFTPSGAPDDTAAARQVAAVLPRDGVVWVGTLGGLERFDPATGERRQVLGLAPDHLRRAPYQDLLADRAGTLWYANAAGVFRIANGGKAERIGGPGAATRLLLDRDGTVWVGRRDGLFRIAGNALEKAWPAASADGNSNVRTLVQAPDGSLWLSVSGSGLVRFEPATGHSRRVHGSPIPASLSEDAIGSLLVDRGGMLWVGGRSRGVAVADPAGARFSYLVDLETEAGRRNPGNDSVRAVHQGTHGTLWIGTDEGRLLRYHGAGRGFEDWTGRMPAPASRRVMAIADAGHGRLWLATSAGLLRLEPDTGTFETIALGGFSHANLRSLLVDRDGSLWLGTYGDGALHYQRDSQRVVHYGHQRGDPRKLAHPSVHALLQDRQGRIWFGTGGGLDVLDRATGRIRHFRHDPQRPDSLPGNMVRALHEDADGTVWVGTHAGLAQVVEPTPGAIAFSLPLADALDRRVPPVVFSIASDGRGRDLRLWLGTDVGIVRYDAASARTHRYGLADGLQDLEFNGGAVATLADGRIAMGGVRGLNLFHPRGMGRTAYSPPLRLLAARVGADAPDEDDTAMWQTGQLEVPDGSHILRLRIGALDYAPAADTRYRYRMAGFDKGWIDNGTQSDITYTRLPPGRYTFRAQATDRNGNWNPAELQLPVHVAPPVWRHPLAITATVLALLALVATVGWRWHRRRQREQGWFQQLREREERLRLALWASGEQFWDYDLASREVHRTRVVESYGDRPETAIHNHVSGDQAIHTDDFPLVREAMLRHLRGEVALFTSEHRTRDNDAQAWRWVRARGRVVERDAAGRAVRVAGTARDITDNRSAERERRISSEVLRSMAEAVAVFDRDFTFISINPAFTRITGYSDVEVFGRATALLDSGRHDPRFYHRMRDELQRDGRWSGEMWQQRKDGGEFLCWLQASAVAGADGTHDHYVAVLGDITDQKRAEQELRYLANYDTLTNLPNRALLGERLARAVARAKAAGTRVAVLFLDLDRFKDINDSFGHATGDRILREAAQRLQQVVGNGHTVARLSGDEFTVVLEDLDGADCAERVARGLIEAFQAPLDVNDGHDLVVSPSIGISLFPDHAGTPADLLKHADTAMYQAKAIGRRAFMRYADSMDVEVRERATISAALRKVLDRNELTLAFQPRMSLAQDRIVAVEALLRWHSPEHGSIPPARFIPVAEETGLILEIGAWALREACATLARWRDEGLEPGISVNVSALQLLRGDLPAVVARVLAETGLPPHLLELELTETVVMANAAGTAATLRALREIGVKLAIDDFGTGYSSLSYLKRLPINTLKIDKDFVDDLCHDPDDAAITSTIITMGHSLGLTVVAEGVEDTGQLGFLRRHGCDEIQGYWLARPLPAGECLALLRGRAQPAVAAL